MKKRFFAFVVTFAMMFSLIPQVHASSQEVADAVAKIERNGVTTVYKTLDEAIKDVKDNDIVQVLKDCETKGLNVTKDFTIQGIGETTPTIHFTEDGIALWGKNLSFEKVNLDMDNVVSTPYRAEWGWMTICAGVNSQLSFKDCSITLDGHNRVYTKGGQKYTGIYVSENADLYFDHCDLSIKNFQGGAIVKDAGRASDLVFENQSTFTATNNYSGLVNTFNVKATNSKIDVVGNRGNGSNGSNYYLDHSTVDFSNNGGHGLSATVIKANDSKITANNNTYAGLLAVTTFDVRNSRIDVINNGYKKNDEYPGVSLKGIKNGFVDKDSTFNIQKNANNGLRIFKNSVLTIEEGADLTIMNNNSNKTTGGNGLGGGIRLVESSTLTLPSHAKVYNNTAELAGDDVYLTSGSKITLGATGEDWTLDGTPNTHDCTRLIDGWYDDSQNVKSDADATQYNRWNAHVQEGQSQAEDFHVVKVEAGTLTGPVALKAAHGILNEDVFETATIPFVKVDSTTGKALAGAEFSVYTDEACQNIFAVLSSDENGQFVLKELPEGTYYLKETKSPQGYEPLKDIIVIEVTKDEQNITSEYVVKGQEVYNVVTHPLKSVVKNQSEYVNVSEDQVVKISNDVLKVDQPEKPSDQDNQTTTPETGDTTSIASYVVIGGIALLAIGGLMISKKKHS